MLQLSAVRPYAAACHSLRTQLLVANAVAGFEGAYAATKPRPPLPLSLAPPTLLLAAFRIPGGQCCSYSEKLRARNVQLFDKQKWDGENLEKLIAQNAELIARKCT